MSLWIARLVWIILPVTVGASVADAVKGWPSAAAITLAVILYGAWFLAALALLVVRPLSFTVLRLVAPVAPAMAIWAGFASDSTWRSIAIVHACVAAVVVLREPVASACAAAAAYGDEQRFALRVPPPFAAVLALAVALFGAGVAAGPLLLANKRWILGAVAVAIGWPVAFAAARSVHGLARRFIVFVPAGLVLSDSLTLTDPVLLPRESMLVIGIAPARVNVDSNVVDTRLGAVIGALLVQMEVPGRVSLRRGAKRTDSSSADILLFTPLRAAVVLKAAGAHRLPVSRLP